MRRKGIAGLTFVVGALALAVFAPGASAHPWCMNTEASITEGIAWTGLPTVADIEELDCEAAAAFANEAEVSLAAEPVMDEVATYNYTSNMTPVGFSARRVLPFTSNAGLNSDLAFKGNLAIQGTYNGFSIVDVSDPANPTRVIDYNACASSGGQGDVVVWGNILVRSWDAPANSTATCAGQLVGQGFEGVHIFDISDPANPVMVKQLRIAQTGMPAGSTLGCGSHTDTIIPDPARGNIYLYIGGSSGTCQGIDIVRVKISDPTDAVYLKRAAAGRQCHDNNAIMGSVNLVMCAGGNGFSVLKFDPSLDPAAPGGLEDPQLLYSKQMPGVSIAHSGSFTYDGKVLVFGHEPSGGTQPRCRAQDTLNDRSIFFMNAQTGDQLGSLRQQRDQTGTENCTWHNFNVVPTRKGYVAVTGNYQMGISVIDFSNPAAPQEVAFADPAPLVHPTNPNGVVAGGDWSTYWRDGKIYESDIRRGVLIWNLDYDAENRARSVDMSNPQTQMASFEQDLEGPSIDITTPTANADYAVGQAVTPVFTCTDNDGVESCTGSSALLDTSTTGAHTFTVTAKDLAGNVSTKSVTYNVLHDDAEGNVNGTVPGTLSLTVGAPASFGAFTPGVARDYTAGTTANVISSAGDATLSVTDPATTNAGHLVNGAFALPQALKARARNAANPATVFGAVGSTPLNLLSYGGPISNDPVSLDFQQTIGATDPLRTGTYNKTLVFTLSTTSP